MPNPNIVEEFDLHQLHEGHDHRHGPGMCDCFEADEFANDLLAEFDDKKVETVEPRPENSKPSESLASRDQVVSTIEDATKIATALQTEQLETKKSEQKTAASPVKPVTTESQKSVASKPKPEKKLVKLSNRDGTLNVAKKIDTKAETATFKEEPKLELVTPGTTPVDRDQGVDSDGVSEIVPKSDVAPVIDSEELDTELLFDDAQIQEASEQIMSLNEDEAFELPELGSSQALEYDFGPVEPDVGTEFDEIMDTQFSDFEMETELETDDIEVSAVETVDEVEPVSNYSQTTDNVNAELGSTVQAEANLQPETETDELFESELSPEVVLFTRKAFEKPTALKTKEDVLEMPEIKSIINKLNEFQLEKLQLAYLSGDILLFLKLLGSFERLNYQNTRIELFKSNTGFSDYIDPDKLGRIVRILRYTLFNRQTSVS